MSEGIYENLDNNKRTIYLRIKTPLEKHFSIQIISKR